MFEKATAVAEISTSQKVNIVIKAVCLVLKENKCTKHRFIHLLMATCNE